MKMFLSEGYSVGLRGWVNILAGTSDDDTCKHLLLTQTSDK